MTQIKLRRDTSANFTSANPVLGVGEPAYETDTKKLKIGDGTTAYTQLEYFSAGGGGSTNISATLPLKIVDGVISLEVDGQTIQIVDGKLHANLDGLSNEVNTLAGDVANKASKSDLAAKQDKLNPIVPLGINQTTISNVTNGTFLTDTSVTLGSRFYINYTTDANARFLISAPGVSGGATPTSFIQIPFTLGDLISFPFEKDNDSNIGLVFGYWKDSLFYPTMLYKTDTYYGSGSNAYVPFAFVSEAGKSSLESIATYYGSSSAVSKSAWNFYNPMPLNATNYIQVTKNAGVPTVNMWFTINGVSYPNSGYTQCMYTSDTTVLENFNKTNVCLLLSYDTSKAINLTKVTRRELGNTVLDPTPDALTTALSTYSNSFDATAKVVTNDLSLAIGSGLSITDGKLVNTNPTAYSLPTASADTLGGIKVGDNLSITEDGTLSATGGGSTPTNMVTTDTTQTITGRKTFGDKIIFNRPDDGAAEPSSILGGEFKLGTSNYDNSIYANQLLLNANTTNAGTFKVQRSSTLFTQINGATITSQRTDTGAYKIINTIRPSGASSNKNYSVLYSEVDGSYNHKLTINNLSSDLVLAGKTVKDGSGNEFLTSGNVTAYVTEEFVDGTEGYRVWSNGRCEQWGSFDGPKSITFLKSYANTNYMLLAYVTLKTSGEAYNGVFGTQKTTTGFAAGGFAGTLNDAWIINACGTVNWYSSGVLAS